MKLNKHGRSYLAEGKSKISGFELLASVANDLDCIYYHLREYPLLCAATVEKDREQEAPQPPISKKRRL